MEVAWLVRCAFRPDRSGALWRLRLSGQDVDSVIVCDSSALSPVTAELRIQLRRAKVPSIETA